MTDAQRRLLNTLLEQHLEGCIVGTRMAGARMDPDGTARIELFERSYVGWWNMTTKKPATSEGMAQQFDDFVVTHLPDKENA